MRLFILLSNWEKLKCSLKKSSNLMKRSNDWKMNFKGRNNKNSCKWKCLRSWVINKNNSTLWFIQLIKLLDQDRIDWSLILTLILDKLNLILMRKCCLIQDLSLQKKNKVLKRNLSSSMNGALKIMKIH